MALPKFTEDPAIYSVRIDMLVVGKPNGVNLIREGLEHLFLKSADGEKFMLDADLVQIVPGTNFKIDWWSMARLKKALSKGLLRIVEKKEKAK